MKHFLVLHLLDNLPGTAKRWKEPAQRRILGLLIATHSPPPDSVGSPLPEGASRTVEPPRHFVRGTGDTRPKIGGIAPTIHHVPAAETMRRIVRYSGLPSHLAFREPRRPLRVCGVISVLAAELPRHIVRGTTALYSLPPGGRGVCYNTKCNTCKKDSKNNRIINLYF